MFNPYPIIRRLQTLPALPAIYMGVDEVGRGPLAGPVVASAVILSDKIPLSEGITDSKLLSSKQREAYALEIKRTALATSVAFVSPATIDRENILRASLLAMKRAIMQLHPTFCPIFIDGIHAPPLDTPSSCYLVVQGDQRISAISAASILAKVERDRYMSMLSQKYPQYGFAAHKGYPTTQHRKVLEQLGPIAEHRRSFTFKSAIPKQVQA